MSTFQDVVLSNDLLKLFYAVQRRCLRCESSADNGAEDVFDFDRAKRLFAYYKPHLTNIRQLEEVLGPDNVNDVLLASLVQSEIPKDASLEQIAELTRYKIILDENRSDFPYVKINETDDIRLLYSGIFKQRMAREKCIQHLKSLCKKATNIIIYDKYLVGHKCENDCKILMSNIVSLFDTSCRVNLIIPCYCENRRKAEDFHTCKEWKILDKCLRELKLSNPNLRYSLPDLEGSVYNNCHDRYMRIYTDNESVEILLSSGFDHLFSNEKDFTYIIRPI